MSLSLHSSMECGGSMSFGSRNSSDMVSEKSRIGLISARISSRPEGVPGSTEERHSSAPISHLNEVVCSARRSGTSSGSLIRAKEMRRGARVDGVDAVEREAAKCGSFSRARGVVRACQATYLFGRKSREAAQTSSVAFGRTAVECGLLERTGVGATAAKQDDPRGQRRQAEAPDRRLYNVVMLFSSQ